MKVIIEDGDGFVGVKPGVYDVLDTCVVSVHVGPTAATFHQVGIDPHAARPAQLTTVEPPHKPHVFSPADVGKRARSTGLTRSLEGTITKVHDGGKVININVISDGGTGWNFEPHQLELVDPSPTQTKALDSMAAVDAALCDECGGTGEYVHMNGRRSPCTKGCKKP